MHASSGDLNMGMSKISGSIYDDREVSQDQDEILYGRNSERHARKSNRLVLKSEDNDHIISLAVA